MEWVIVVAVFVLLFITAIRLLSPNTAHSKVEYEEDISMAKSFSPPYSKEYQLYDKWLEIPGFQYYKSNIIKFSKGTNHRVEFQRERDNEFDPNAIGIFGISSGKKYKIGYVDKELAKIIVESDFYDKIKARLLRIYISKRAFIEVRYQIIGLKTHKKEYDQLG